MARGLRLLGLVVNPVAGVGGPAGLKGSDSPEIQQQAMQRGSTLRAHERAVSALRELPTGVRILTAGGLMGEAAVREAGRVAEVVYQPATPSSPEDTAAAVRALVAAGAELLLFVGGDGTARDCVRGLEPDSQTAMLGVPAGVKMYSSCFAVSPSAAGRVASAWRSGLNVALEDREVLDVSEEQIRLGRVEATLYGLVAVPVVAGRTQARKAATSDSEADAVRSVAVGVVSRLQPGHNYLLGPGSTMMAVARELGVAKTPLGVDVVRDGRLVASDCSEAELLDLVAQTSSHAVVTVIGGQGFLLGRGNQQISSAVLERLAEPPLLVAATANKLLGLPGPLLIDTGDARLDARLAGFKRVITGSQDTAVVAAVAASAEIGDKE